MERKQTVTARIHATTAPQLVPDLSKEEEEG
jgi:hypothetical protein